jgi:hypothetical protein
LDQVPRKTECTLKALKDKKILYRYEGVPRGWFRGIVRNVKPKGKWNVRLGFTSAGCGGAVTETFDTDVLLEPSSYGVNRTWVFVAKKNPASKARPSGKRRRA